MKENEGKLQGVNFQTVSDSVFKKISDTVTPQGVLAVVAQKENTLDEILNNRRKNKSCIVVLDRLQDPGNLGTILRTAEGAGVSGIVMSSDCADIYNPKVIRSTMGSIFRVPFAVVDDLPAAVERIREKALPHMQPTCRERIIIKAYLKRILPC